jgi:hypothetical protein
MNKNNKKIKTKKESDYDIKTIAYRLVGILGILMVCIAAGIIQAPNPEALKWKALLLAFVGGFLFWRFFFGKDFWA